MYYFYSRGDYKLKSRVYIDPSLHRFKQMVDYSRQSSSRRIPKMINLAFESAQAPQISTDQKSTVDQRAGSTDMFKCILRNLQSASTFVRQTLVRHVVLRSTYAREDFASQCAAAGLGTLAHSRAYRSTYVSAHWVSEESAPTAQPAGYELAAAPAPTAVH